MKWLKFTAIAFFGTLTVGILGLALLTAHYSRRLPTLDALKNYQPRLVTRVLDRNDKVMADFSTERRITITPDEMPKVVVDAFVSAEDDDFFSHRGVNPLTILRAAFRNAQAGHTVQGGSTITQQVAKSILLTPERSFDRKIKEMILAFRIERALTKPEILTLYLNQIFLGSGAYGIESAALTYYGKSAKDLTLPEAAVLAGLPRAPSRDNPLVNPKGALQKQHYVLRRMLDTQRISKDDYTRAVETPLHIHNRPQEPLGAAPYATEYVRRYLVQKYGSERVYEDGLRAYTTIDLDLTKAAQDAIKGGLLQLDKRIGLRRPHKNLASNTDRQAWLKRQHNEIVERFYDYKILTPDGELQSPIKGDEPTPIELAKNYPAVILDKDRKTRGLVVQVGNRKGVIRPADYAWVSAADPDEVYAETVIRAPFAELKTGDLVTVQPKVLDAGKEEFFLEQEPLVQGALLSYDVPTGELVSMVGGYDYAVTKSEFNRAVQAVRQPGSTFKPFVYGAALESGLTPSTIIVDSPIVYRDTDEKTQMEKVWRPGNSGDKFYGDTRLREAITWSRNIPTIKLLQYLKVQTVIDYARRLGIKSNLNPDLSLALGSSGVTLEELVGAYGVFANSGQRLPLHFIRKVEDRDGNILEEWKSPEKPEQVVASADAFLVTSLLKSVVETGTGTVVKPIGRPAAGKTGTTSDSKDALFLGYTPQVVTGVWVGFDEDRPIGRNETGSRAAAPIWLQYMQIATAKQPVKDWAVPEDVTQVQVDEVTGDVPTPRTQKRVTDYFRAGTAPGQTAPYVTGPDGVTVAATGPNKTKVVTGNPDLPTSSDAGAAPTDNGLTSDEFYRNDL